MLVAASSGFAEPLGGDGRTLARLARTLDAPAVVVATEGAAARDALEVLEVPAAVVTVGDAGVEGLPVTPAGRIPAELPRNLGVAARGWLDPALHAGPVRKPWSQKRAALIITAAVVVLALLCWGLAFLLSEEPRPMLPG